MTWPPALFVVMINEALAHKYFAGKDPLGQQINLGGKDTGMIKPYTIVRRSGQSGGQERRRRCPTVHSDSAAADPDHFAFYQALLKTIVSFVVKPRETFR